MKFPTDRPVKVVMLGAGGTGGYVAPYVFRLLHIWSWRMRARSTPCLNRHLPKHRNGSPAHWSSAMPCIRICWRI